ncbi:MAG: GNAT family N-acetyltransferase [Gammaproteobacteria bacterium]
MQYRIVESISDIDPDDWNRLQGTDNPFLRHEFLAALELSDSVSRATGWRPRHALALDDDHQLVAALPLYLKDNSYGEFVFDFSWANAYQQAGLHYYPKLVAAVPFTPASGQRILVAEEQDYASCSDFMVRSTIAYAKELNVSSLHVLFPEEDETTAIKKNGLLLRKDCQFHWHNRDYSSFDDFLQSFTSSKRKKTRRERKKIAEAGIRFESRSGHDMSAELWAEILPMYARTFWQRGRPPYLNDAFFEQISATLPDNLVVFIARQNSAAVATAICFRSDTRLYGRYWGASTFVDSLHFETCYYQGIEYCIEHGLDVFEPGTQGEHKISRGFVPAETWSAHWLSDSRFFSAVDNFLDQERQHINNYMDLVRDHSPYRED